MGSLGDYVYSGLAVVGFATVAYPLLILNSLVWGPSHWSPSRCLILGTLRATVVTALFAWAMAYV